MYVVSGCPRSGTSAMMNGICSAIGENHIIGDKFPLETRFNNILSKDEEETEEHRQARIYAFKKKNPNYEENLEKAKDMNPLGFWECSYTVQGVKWHLGIHLPVKSVCKIVSHGLSKSDPQYIDKIIMMVRDPKQVAKSQERLRRLAILQELKIHSPRMFVVTTLQLAEWMVANQDKPLLIVNFDDMISEPHETFRKIGEFLEWDGDWTAAANTIKKELKRSYPEPKIHPLWDEALHIYELFKRGDFDAMIDYGNSISKKLTQTAASWLCPRMDTQVMDNECQQCFNSQIVRNNFKLRAERKNIDWENEPCLYECGFDYRREKYKTIEQSIAENHWKNEEKPLVMNAELLQTFQAKGCNNCNRRKINAKRL